MFFFLYCFFRMIFTKNYSLANYCKKKKGKIKILPFKTISEPMPKYSKIISKYPHMVWKISRYPFYHRAAVLCCPCSFSGTDFSLSFFIFLFLLASITLWLVQITIIPRQVENTNMLKFIFAFSSCQNMRVITSLQLI